MNVPHFYRKNLRLPKTEERMRNGVPSTAPAQGTSPVEVASNEGATDRRSEAPNVLVINGSTQMASAITRQLLIALPHANIMYAPTIDLAGWILKTRPIQLIISSEVLPDGGAHKLHSVVRRLRTPPDLLMVGHSVHGSVQELRKAGYKLVSRKTIGDTALEAPKVKQPIKRHRSVPISERVSTLSADLRNDLNNPLQEIVTMAFVAKQTREQQALSTDALNAIEKAAKQLAGTVNGLEERIKQAVSS